ncbi:MAG TPA: hypothetical protein VJW20_25125 [Candidatus Angelobacter sp.]|nr:hypothetical protein [Candidatus Angelobacter sp.]
MTPLQSPASVQAQIRECIVQNQHMIEWSQQMMARSEESMRQTGVRLDRGAVRKKLFKLPAEVPVSPGSRFFALEL